MKIELELVTDESGNPEFLNFWDWVRGEDLCLENIDGKWYRDIYEDSYSDSVIHTQQEVSLDAFLQLVGEKVAANEAYISSLEKQ